MNDQTSVSCKPGTAAGQEVVLRTRGLTKLFGKLEAVKDLDLELRRGEVFGFLGPNGSGKSTTVGMVLGLIQPTAGDIEVFGLRLQENMWPVLRRVGAVVESPAFYPYLSGWDNLEVLARAIGDIPRARISDVLERVNLRDRSSDAYGHYSLGMKQRLGIASILLRDPELVILDEPANGLDPAGTKEIRGLITALAAEGRTVFLCSHLLHEVEQVCHRVAVIKQGRLLACAPVKELLSQGHTLQISVADAAAAESVLKALPWISGVTREDGYLVVRVAKEDSSRVSAALAEHRIFPSEMISRSLSLENVFLELTGGKSGD